MVGKTYLTLKGFIILSFVEASAL